MEQFPPFKPPHKELGADIAKMTFNDHLQSMRSYINFCLEHYGKSLTYDLLAKTLREQINSGEFDGNDIDDVSFSMANEIYDFMPRLKLACLYAVLAETAIDEGNPSKAWSFLVEAAKYRGMLDTEICLPIFMKNRPAAPPSEKKSKTTELRKKVQAKILELAAALSDDDLKELTTNKNRHRKRTDTYGIKQLSRASVMERIEPAIAEMYREHQIKYIGKLAEKVGQFSHNDADFSGAIDAVMVTLEARASGLHQH